MADNAQKTPIAQTLNRFADGKITSAAQLLGKSIPASAVSVDGTNTIVTVKLEVQGAPFKFPEITCPVYGPQWVRWPIQPGDPGVCFSSEYYLGGMSGLGGGVAGLNQMMNLGTLVWFPIGNANFNATDNAQAVVIYGPDGAIIRTTDAAGGKLKVDTTEVEASVSPVRSVTDKDGFKVYIGNYLALVVDVNGARFSSPSGAFGIRVTDGGTYIDEVNFLPHNHGGVVNGPDDTAGVNP